MEAKALAAAEAASAGAGILTQIFEASLVPYEMAMRMRKHFRIGPHCWTLIVAA